VDEASDDLCWNLELARGNIPLMLQLSLLFASFLGLTLHLDPAYVDVGMPLQVVSAPAPDAAPQSPADDAERVDSLATPIASPEDAATAARARSADDAAEEESSPQEPSYGEQMEGRQSVAGIHKILGITTFAAMGMTLALGAIQYRNLYGAFDSRGQNPCARGDATFGQGQCSGTPWLHLISGVTTFALYTTTFSLAVAMPDPGGLDEGRGVFARRLRLHKALRWVHLIGMVAQMGLGFVIANGPRFGLDRTNDYGTLQGLATAHLAAGIVTFAALGWAGYLMAF